MQKTDDDKLPDDVLLRSSRDSLAALAVPLAFSHIIHKIDFHLNSYSLSTRSSIAYNGCRMGAFKLVLVCVAVLGTDVYQCLIYSEASILGKRSLKMPSRVVKNQAARLFMSLVLMSSLKMAPL